MLAATITHFQVKICKRSDSVSHLERLYIDSLFAQFNLLRTYICDGHYQLAFIDLLKVN